MLAPFLLSPAVAITALICGTTIFYILVKLRELHLRYQICDRQLAICEKIVSDKAALDPNLVMVPNGVMNSFTMGLSH